MIALAAGILVVCASAAGWVLIGVVVVDELVRRQGARAVRSRRHAARRDDGCPL